MFHQPTFDTYDRLHRFERLVLPCEVPRAALVHVSPRGGTPVQKGTPMAPQALTSSSFAETLAEEVDLRLALANNPTAVMELDMDGRVRYLLLNWVTMVGTKPKKIVGRPISLIMIGNTADDLRVFNDAIDKMISDDCSYKVKFITATNDVDDEALHALAEPAIAGEGDDVSFAGEANGEGDDELRQDGVSGSVGDTTVVTDSNSTGVSITGGSISTGVSNSKGDSISTGAISTGVSTGDSISTGTEPTASELRVTSDDSGQTLPDSGQTLPPSGHLPPSTHHTLPPPSLEPPSPDLPPSPSSTASADATIVRRPLALLAHLQQSNITNNGDVIELEAQGILIHEKGVPSYLMWTIKPWVHIDLDLLVPPRLIDLLGFGAEMFEGYLGNLTELGIISDEAVPQPKTVLCRICEATVPAWFIERHLDLCIVEHRADEELQACHDNVSEQRQVILLIIELLAAPPVPVPAPGSASLLGTPLPRLGLPLLLLLLVVVTEHVADYHGIPLPAVAPGHLRHGKKFPFGILQHLVALCDDALAINPPRLVEDGVAQLLPPTERLLAMVAAAHAGMETLDPAIRAIIDDTEEMIADKVAALLRLVVLLQFGDKIKREVDALVLATVHEAVERIKELTMELGLSRHVSRHDSDPRRVRELALGPSSRLGSVRRSRTLTLTGERTSVGSGGGSIGGGSIGGGSVGGSIGGGSAGGSVGGSVGGSAGGSVGGSTGSIAVATGHPGSNPGTLVSDSEAASEPIRPPPRPLDARPRTNSGSRLSRSRTNSQTRPPVKAADSGDVSPRSSIRLSLLRSPLVTRAGDLQLPPLARLLLGHRPLADLKGKYEPHHSLTLSQLLLPLDFEHRATPPRPLGTSTPRSNLEWAAGASGSSGSASGLGVSGSASGLASGSASGSGAHPIAIGSAGVSTVPGASSHSPRGSGDFRGGEFSRSTGTAGSPGTIRATSSRHSSLLSLSRLSAAKASPGSHLPPPPLSYLMPDPGEHPLHLPQPLRTRSPTNLFGEFGYTKLVTPNDILRKPELLTRGLLDQFEDMPPKLALPRRHLLPAPYVEKQNLSLLQRAVPPVPLLLTPVGLPRLEHIRRDLLDFSTPSSLPPPAQPGAGQRTLSQGLVGLGKKRPPLLPLLVLTPPAKSLSLGGIKDYEVVKPISKGAFGLVFLAKKKTTGDYVAIKCLKKTDMIAKNQILNVKLERAVLMRQANSPYVTQLYGTFQLRQYLYLVMEYLAGGDLLTLVKNLGTIGEWAHDFIAQIVVGVDDLHQRGIIHRDLKPDNILIDAHGHLKLTDFGLLRIGVVGRQRQHQQNPRRGLVVEARTVLSAANSPSLAPLELMPPMHHKRTNLMTPFSLLPTLEATKAAGALPSMAYVNQFAQLLPPLPPLMRKGGLALGSSAGTPGESEVGALGIMGAGSGGSGSGHSGHGGQSGSTSGVSGQGGPVSGHSGSGSGHSGHTNSGGPSHGPGSGPSHVGGQPSSSAPSLPSSTPSLASNSLASNSLTVPATQFIPGLGLKPDPCKPEAMALARLGSLGTLGLGGSTSSVLPTASAVSTTSSLPSGAPSSALANSALPSSTPQSQLAPATPVFPRTNLEMSFHIVDDEFTMSPMPAQPAPALYTLFDPLKLTPQQSKKFVGTPDYLSPETILGEGQLASLDWWLVGCILFEFIYGYPPFHAQTADQVLQNICKGEIDWPGPEVEAELDYCPPEAKDLISQLLVADPDARLGSNGAEAIKNHPFLADVDWDRLFIEDGPFVPPVDDPELTDYFDSRGADLAQFPDDDDEPVGLGSPANALAPQRVPSGGLLSALGVPKDQRRDRRGSRLADANEFGLFYFRNLAVLEKANKDAINRLKHEHLEHRLLFSLPTLLVMLELPLTPLTMATLGLAPRGRGLSFGQGSNPGGPASGQGSLSAQGSHSAQGSVSGPFKRPVLPVPPSLGGLLPMNPPQIPPHGFRTTLPSKDLPYRHERMESLISNYSLGDDFSFEKGLPLNDLMLIEPQKLYHRPLALLLGLFRDLPQTLDLEDTKLLALLRVQKRRQLNRRPATDSRPGSFDGLARPSFEQGSFSGQGFDVLYCEPAASVRVATTKLLERQGCVVVGVADGDELIRRATGQVKFDLILTCMRLAKVGAVDATKLIKFTTGVNSQTPIVAVTIHPDEAAALGVFDYVMPKPVDDAAVVKCLAKFVISDEAIASEDED